MDIWRDRYWHRAGVVRSMVPAAAALTLSLVGCGSIPTRTQPANPASAGESIDQLAAAVAADAARSDHESDAKVREQLADDALDRADACVAKAPDAASCLYERGIALGLQARAHPARALDLLKSMLDALTRAESADPGYDQAGPARVRALVLARAPGWPLGPGDADAAIEAARRATTLRPQYVPNWLALAEAQSKSADAAGARETYTRARDLARALPAGAERDDWLRQANQGLERK